MDERQNSSVWVAIRRLIWRLDHLVSGGGSSAAPSDPTYLLKTADAALPNAYTLADGTSIKTTWAGGIATPNIYIASQANGDVIYFNGTNWVRLGIGGAGTYMGVSGGIPAWVANPVTAHVALSDPHTQYQLESEKGAANGYAPLNASSLVPVGNLGSGAPTGTKFLRDDGTWQVPGGGGGTMDHASLTSNLLASSSGHYLAAGSAGRLWGFDAAGAYSSYVIGTDVQAWDQDLADIAGIARVRGDLMVADSTPKWTRLPLGTAGYPLVAGATDPSYAKITQSVSHDSPDTDSAPTALHHTLGTGANQAAAGNHSHGWTGRSGALYLAQASLGSTYETARGGGLDFRSVFVQLVNSRIFTRTRAVALATPEYGWTWDNRTALTSADENTTTANAVRMAHGATSTNWAPGAYTGPYRYRTHVLRHGGFAKVVSRIATNADADIESPQLIITDAADASKFIRIGSSYQAAVGGYRAYVYTGTLASQGVTSAQMAAGIWYQVLMSYTGGQIYWSGYYSVSVAEPAWNAYTLLTSGTLFACGPRTLKIGQALVSNNTSGTLTADWLSYSVDVDDFGAWEDRPWNAQQYDTTGATQYLGYTDVGVSDALDLAALRYDLAGRTNTRHGDSATVEWSVVRSTLTAAPGASTWSAAAAVVEDGAGRYVHVYMRITSSGTTQGSIDYSHPIIVRVA